MKIRFALILFLIGATFLSTAQESTADVALPLSENCKALLTKKLTFLLDGSFQDEVSLQKEITRLKECGLDDFDITFFGRMNSMSAMLRKMTKDKQVEQLTFKDLMGEITKMKATAAFSQVKKITLLSETLATRVGSLKNWNEDIKIFQELGASKKIITQVFEYLESHSSNKKTYQEILESFKK